MSQSKIRSVIHCLPKEVEEINKGGVLEFPVYLIEDSPNVYSGYIKGPIGTGYSHKNIWIQRLDFSGYPSVPSIVLKYPYYHPNVGSGSNPSVCTGNLSSSWGKNPTVRRGRSN